MWLTKLLNFEVAQTEVCLYWTNEQGRNLYRVLGLLKIGEALTSMLLAATLKPMAFRAAVSMFAISSSEEQLTHIRAVVATTPNNPFFID